MESIHVSFRLSRDAWERYSDEAQALGVALGTYLRNRLEHVDRFLASELALRAGPAQATAAPAPAGPAPLPPSVLLELLLVVRQLASPEKVGIAQGELRRLGLDVWSSGKSPGR